MVNYRLLEKKLLQTLNTRGFEGLDEVSVGDIDGLFEHYVRLYRQKKISPLEMSYFCDSFFKIVNFDQIYFNSKYASHIFSLCDIHSGSSNPEIKKRATRDVREILSDVKPGGT